MVGAGGAEKTMLVVLVQDRVLGVLSLASFPMSTDFIVCVWVCKTQTVRANSNYVAVPFVEGMYDAMKASRDPKCGVGKAGDCPKPWARDESKWVEEDIIQRIQNGNENGLSGDGKSVGDLGRRGEANYLPGRSPPTAMQNKGASPGPPYQYSSCCPVLDT